MPLFFKWYCQWPYPRKSQETSVRLQGRRQGGPWLPRCIAAFPHGSYGSLAQQRNEVFFTRKRRSETMVFIRGCISYLIPFRNLGCVFFWGDGITIDYYWCVFFRGWDYYWLLLITTDIDVLVELFLLIHAELTLYRITAGEVSTRTDGFIPEMYPHVYV